MKGSPGRPSNQPAYDFSRHLDYLAIVLPAARPLPRRLFDLCVPSYPRRISDRAFADQIRGRENYFNGLPHLLSIHIPLAKYGVEPGDWIDFEKFKEKLPQPGSLATAADRLRALLQGWTKVSPISEISSPDALLPRRAGDYEPLPSLNPGLRTFKYKVAAPEGSRIYLLILEYDETIRDWQCINALKGVSLAIGDARRPSGGVEIGISASPGVCEIFAVAKPKPFHHGLVRLIDNLAEQGGGAMSDERTAQMLNYLEEEDEDAPVNRQAGRFRYRV